MYYWFLTSHRALRPWRCKEVTPWWHKECAVSLLNVWLGFLMRCILFYLLNICDKLLVISFNGVCGELGREKVFMTKRISCLLCSNYCTILIKGRKYFTLAIQNVGKVSLIQYFLHNSHTFILSITLITLVLQTF